jgi:hypothetical protein
VGDSTDGSAGDGSAFTGRATTVRLASPTSLPLGSNSGPEGFQSLSLIGRAL